MEYNLLKFLHLGALIFWLGPALGAWLVLKATDDEGINPTTEKVNRAFFMMIVVEHIAFVALIGSGLLMAIEYGWLASPWLQQKLYLVALVLLPLELIDILLGNWLAAKASARLYAGQKVSTGQKKWIALYHGPFTKLALVLVPISVTFIMFLAISKTPLF